MSKWALTFSSLTLLIGFMKRTTSHFLKNRNAVRLRVYDYFSITSTGAKVYCYFNSNV